MSATDEVRLTVWRAPEAGAEEALAVARERSAPEGDRVVVLAYAPQELRFEALTDTCAPPTGCYELRAFGTRAEVRWVAAQGAVLVTADGGDGPEGWEAVVDRPATTLGRSYLLWGTLERRGERVRSVEHRVPPLDLTSLARAEWKDGKTVALYAEEFLAPDDAYGNVAVIAERLVGLEVWKEGGHAG